MSLLILTFLIYAVLVLLAFGRNVHNNTVYEHCNYEDLKSEMLCDLMDAACFTYTSLKGITKQEAINFIQSFFNFFIAYIKKFRKLKNRKDWLTWAAEKYNSKNLVFTFLLFFVLKLMFEHHGEQNIYDYITTRKMQY